MRHDTPQDPPLDLDFNPPPQSTLIVHLAANKASIPRTTSHVKFSLAPTRLEIAAVDALNPFPNYQAKIDKHLNENLLVKHINAQCKTPIQPMYVLGPPPTPNVPKIELIHGDFPVENIMTMILVFI